MRRTLALLLLLVPALAPAAAAQAAARATAAPPPSIAAATLRGAPPVVDGRLDDAAWQEASAATAFVQRAPNPGAPASQRTEVRVLVGAGAVYVSARMFDQPDSVAAQLSRRDAGGTYSDWAYVMLDSDDDNRSAFAFAVNPLGVQRDFIQQEDGGSDEGWDAVWEGKARKDSLGWTAEFRIPLSQLRYTEGARAWGVNFRRDIARREEVAYWAPIPPDAAGHVSRYGVLTGTEGIPGARRLEVQPYAVTRMTRAPGDGSDPFYNTNDVAASGGFDFRYGPSSALTLSGTVNPDFGQVEADPSQVNLTAFETFFPERRPFFVEGSDIFDFGLGGDAGQLFYSRRIGAAPHGGAPGEARFTDIPQRTTILGAAKLSGKTANGWSLGVMNALTASEDATYITADGTRHSAPVEPLTDFGVMRVIRDFRGGESAVGGILTTVRRSLQGDGLDFLHTAAYTGGVDWRHRFGGGDYAVTGYAVGSRVEGSADAIALTQQRPGRYFQRPDAENLEFDPTRTSLMGMVGNLEVKKIGGGHWRWEAGGRVVTPGFEANDVGFQPKADVVSHFGTVEYLEFNPGKVFRNWHLLLHEGANWTTAGERTDASTFLYANAQLKNYWTLTGVVQRNLAGLSTSDLRGGPALALPGENSAQLVVQSDARRAVGGSVYGLLARQDEGLGHTTIVGGSLTARPSPRVDLSLEPQVVLYETAQQYLTQGSQPGGMGYYFGRMKQTTTALTARLSYTFSPTLSLQFYGSPFISAGAFSDYTQVTNSRARRFADRFTPAEVEFNPDFNVKQFRSNAVLRWEYRPGSTMFVVWNSGLDDYTNDGTYAFGRDFRRLAQGDATNTLLVKFSYWFGL